MENAFKNLVWVNKISIFLQREGKKKFDCHLTNLEEQTTSYGATSRLICKEIEKTRKCLEMWGPEGPEKPVALPAPTAAAENGEGHRLLLAVWCFGGCTPAAKVLSKGSEEGRGTKR